MSKRTALACLDGMTKTALLGLAACVTAACTSSDSGVHLTWSLASGGQPLDCPKGASVVVTANNDNTSIAPEASMFDCTDAGGSVDLGVGHWTIGVALLDRSGQILWQRDMPAVVHAGQMVELGNVEMVYLGKLSMSWTLTSGGTPVACAEKGVTTVEVVTFYPAAPPRNGFLAVTDLPCADLSGTTAELAAGKVGLGVYLIDAQRNVIKSQQMPGQLIDIVADKTTDLGRFEFEL